MADQNDMQAAQNEIWSVDSLIKDLTTEETSAAHHLCRSISVLDSNSSNNQQLLTVKAAERNLRELASMSMNLGQAYVDNALNLDRDADLSVSLEKTNYWLSYCYFMIGLSKAMDAYAQYVGGPAKLITELKTPATDIAKSLTDKKRPPGQVEGLPLAQAANGTMIALLQGFPEEKALVDLQKGLAATIEFIKDLADRWKRRGAIDNFWSSDMRLSVAEALEATAKFIDVANRALTAYDVTPRLAPNFVKNLAPDRVRQLSPIPKAKLDKVKAWISGIKYTLEALANFLSACLSLADFFESRKAAKQAGDLALRQLAPTGGGAFDPRMDMFAHATKADLIKLIHEVNSSADAQQMAHIAIDRIRDLKGEIDRLGNQHQRQLNFLDFNLKRIADFKSRLRESDRRLERYRQSIAKLGPEASIRDGRDDIGRDGMLSRIDSARGRISRLVNPTPPNWISPRGRFGPRIGTM